MPVYRALPTPDYGRLIMQGLGAYQTVKGIQRGEEKAEQEKLVRELTAKAQSDPEALQQLYALNPQAASGIERIQLQRQQAEAQRQQQEAKLEADRVKRFETERASTAALIKDLPLDGQIQTLDWRLGMLQRRGSDPSGTQNLRNMLASGDPQQIAQAQNEIQSAYSLGEIQGYLKPGKTETRTALAKNLELLQDPSLTDEQRDIVLANLTGTQTTIETTPGGGTRVVMGKGVRGQKGDLTKRTTGELEKTLVSGERQLVALNRLDNQFNKDFLTYQGKGQAFLSGIKSKAGIGLSKDEKDFLKNRRRFTQNVNRFFNAYRKDITGAAASVQELESLKKAVFNEDLSPDEFKGAFDEFKSELLRAQRLNRRLLREGVTGNPKNKQSPAAQQLDALFLAGEDDSAVSRVSELMNEGRSEEEIYQTLQDEGYSF